MAPSSSRAAQPQLHVGRPGDYVDDEDLDNVIAALEAEPNVTCFDFVGEDYVDGMVEFVLQANVGQEEKEAEWRQIAKDQPFVFLDDEED